MRAFFLCLVGIVMLSGCSNYRLGTSGTVKFKTLYVAPIVNESGSPQTVAIVSTQVREAFLRDPRVILVNTPEEADATLTIHLTKYSRESQVRQQVDTGLTRKFDVKITGDATLVDNRDNKKLFEKRKLEATRQVFTDNGQQLQAEYQNIPLLAETLAQNVVSATLDIW